MRKKTPKRKDNEPKDDPFELPDEGIWRVLAVLTYSPKQYYDHRYFWFFILRVALPLLFIIGIFWWKFG